MAKAVAKKTLAAQAKEILQNALHYHKLSKKEIAILATNAQCSRLYAEKVLYGAFAEGEDAISKSAAQSYLYCRDVLSTRFKLGEEAISKSSYYATEYAINILRKRWPKGEAAILTNAVCAAAYASKIIRGRWEEAEDIISTDGEASLEYAKIVKRFEKGEDAISKNAELSVDYAKIIGGRFEKGEDAIAKDQYNILEYACFIEQRFEKGEAFILSEGEYSWNSIRYATDVVKDRWIELENKILESNDNDLLHDYALKMTEIGIKMPEEIHNRLLMMGITEDLDMEGYFRSLKELEDKRKLDLITHLTVDQLKDILSKIN